MILPSLGRVLWFRPAINEPTPVDGTGYCAAIITCVHSPNFLNLTVFDANGNATPRTSVPLIQEGQWPPGGGYYAVWMPFQIDQAQRAEAAEKALAAAGK